MKAQSDIDLLVELVKKADHKTLLMSRMNCHAKNVDSIVLREDSRGRLNRAFLAWPGHRLHTNKLDDDLEVGIHDHRYDISLLLIHGVVTNVTYDRAGGPGDRLIEWRFRSGVVNGKPERERIGECRLVETSRTLLNRDSWVGQDKNVLHTIECSGAAAWFVQEGTTAKDTTTLFTKRDFSTDGLYDRLESRSHVVARVLDWAKEARK